MLHTIISEVCICLNMDLYLLRLKLHFSCCMATGPASLASSIVLTSFLCPSMGLLLHEAEVPLGPVMPEMQERPLSAPRPLPSAAQCLPPAAPPTTQRLPSSVLQWKQFPKNRLTRPLQCRTLNLSRPSGLKTPLQPLRLKLLGIQFLDRHMEGRAILCVMGGAPAAALAPILLGGNLGPGNLMGNGARVPFAATAPETADTGVTSVSRSSNVCKEEFYVSIVKGSASNCCAGLIIIIWNRDGVQGGDL